MARDPYLGPGGASKVRPRASNSSNQNSATTTSFIRPPASFPYGRGRGRFQYSQRVGGLYSSRRATRAATPTLGSRGSLATAIRNNRNAINSARRREGNSSEEYRRRLAAPYTSPTGRIVSPTVGPARALGKTREAKEDDERAFVTRYLPSGAFMPTFTGAGTLARDPAMARRSGSEIQRRKEREQSQYWKGVADSYKERFPGQAETIDRIVEIEQMPETTIQERRAKNAAFEQVTAKGGLAPWLSYLSTGTWSRSEDRMRGVDTMLQRDRYAKSFAFIEDSTQFDLSQMDVADMIAAGIITYGKTKRSGYRNLVHTVNQDAMERFLDDNFTTDENGKYVRKTANLVFSEEFNSRAYSLDANNNTIVDTNPRTAASEMIDLPRLGNEEPDYSGMATEFMNDEMTYATLTSKIEDKIRDDGGGAILDKIYSGNFTEQDIQDLKPYMYSFSGGPYVGAQERWINERLRGIGPKDWADDAVNQRTEANLTALFQANAEERQKAREAEMEAAQGTAEANFRMVDEVTGQVVNVRPVEEWPQALTAIIDSGVAGVVPRDILNEIFFEDVLTAKRRDLDPDVKKQLYVSVIEATQAGAPVDPFIIQMVESFGENITDSEVAEEMITREQDGRSWWQRGVGASMAAAVNFGPGNYIASVLGGTAAFAMEDDTNLLQGFEQSLKLTTTQPQKLVEEFTVGRVARMMTDPVGPLSPTKTDTVFSAAFLDNAIKSPIRAALGMPMGIYMAATDPKGTGMAILQDYAQRYGQLWGREDANFVESALMDPWAPAMDLLGLVPVVGFGAKAAQAARIAAVTRRVNLGPEDIGPRVRVGFAGLRPGDLQGQGFRYDVSLDPNSRFYDAEAPSVSPLMVDDMGPTYGSIRDTGLKKIAAATASGKPLRTASAWTFAQAQRRALTGDARAYARLTHALPEGMGGLNSSYTPHLMDKVASWFEPRWTPFSVRDVVPEGTSEEAAMLGEAVAQEAAAKRGISPEQIMEIETAGGPLRRRAGSPIARGAQDLLFTIQKGIAKRKPSSPIVNMPLLGFNFRYVNALKLEPYGAMDLLQRDLHTNIQQQAMIKANKFSDAEQLAVMSLASGGMYSPSFLLSIALQKAETMRSQGVEASNATLRLLDDEIDLLSRPEFLDDLNRALAEANDVTSQGVPATMRGKQLRGAAEMIRSEMIRTRHRAGVEMDAPSARELTLRYQLFFNAARLNVDDLIDELDSQNLTDRVAVLNGGYHFLETGKIDDLPDGEGNNLRSVMRELEDADDATYAAIIERIRNSVDYMSRDANFRNMDNLPLFVVDRVEDIAGRKFVFGRRLRVAGNFDKTNERVRRERLVDDEELVLPAEAFHKVGPKDVRKARQIDAMRLSDDEYIMAYSTRDGSAAKRGVDEEMSELGEQLNRATLNFSMKLFPKARDFADKAVYRGALDEVETFEQRINENIIADSGLISFDLDLQFAAMRNAAYRRFNQDIQTTIEESAIMITRDQARRFSGAYRALRTMKVHDSREKAQQYLDRERPRTSGEEGAIVEYTLNGETKYVTRMSYIDSVAVSLKEARQQRLTGADEWKQAMYEDLDDIDFTNADDLIMVVPRAIAEGLEDSYRRSRSFAHKYLRTYTSAFKLMALSLNPRFVTQQFFGTMTLMMLMNPMQAGHILARFFEYSLNKRSRAMATGKWRKGIEVDPYENHGTDYDIIYNRFIREMEDQIYGEDAMQAFEGKFKGPKYAFARQVATSGYIFGMAIEKNFRVAIIRESALKYPGFKDFMNNNPDVAARALEGIPEMGYTSVSKFHAAMDLLSDPRSKYYDPLFLRELRHTADMVSGNYRDFTHTERMVRDMLIPFYAWTRHSALYSKRMIQERPLTANSLYNLGNYGYEQIAMSGGLPDWLLESVPMPEVVAEVLGLDPEKDNRLGFGLINPFGTTGQTLQMGAGFLRGAPFNEGSGIFDVTNPLIELFVEQSTGRSLLTGAPKDPEQGFAENFISSLQTLPPLRIAVGLAKTSADLNELRGMSDPSDILKDPYDPNSKLNIPKPKFSTKYPTLTRAGIVNSTAIPLYSLDPDQLGTAIAREYKSRNVAYEQFKLNEQRKQLKTANALQNWAYKRDFVYNVWLPAFGQDNPELAARVLMQLEREKPSIPDGFNPASAQAILSGALGG